MRIADSLVMCMSLGLFCEGIVLGMQVDRF